MSRQGPAYGRLEGNVDGRAAIQLYGCGGLFVAAREAHVGATTILVIVLAVLFFGGHVILSSPALRPALMERLGQRGFTMLYSALAMICSVTCSREAVSKTFSQ